MDPTSKLTEITTKTSIEMPNAKSIQMPEQVQKPTEPLLPHSADDIVINLSDSNSNNTAF